MKEKLFTKNFTLLVLGQVSSLFGNYIMRLALSMYVLELTESAAVFAGLLSSVVCLPTPAEKLPEEETCINGFACLRDGHTGRRERKE